MPTLSKAQVKENTSAAASAIKPIDFDEVKEIMSLFAVHIKKNYNKIVDTLLIYETFEVAKDEISRTLDTLLNIDENSEYFGKSVDQITAFLPKNQPLYALTCFVIIPSFQAKEVHFRIPHAMRHFFSDLLSILNFKIFFQNIVISDMARIDFLTQRTAILLNKATGEMKPVSDVVIFTGSSAHAEKLRVTFHKKTLFIANGSGHNPLVVSNDACLKEAVEGAITLQMYNQGQDCAAPNSILVHSEVYEKFCESLHNELQKIKVGNYSDQSCRVGPISDKNELIRVQTILCENQKWIDPLTPGIICTKKSIVSPTVIKKPLAEGGNYTELFSPLMFIQVYEKDTDLGQYFESAIYARNAMYICIYGNSNYINSITSFKWQGKQIHDEESIIRNTHLHAEGIERGVRPYGGKGFSASTVSHEGKLHCFATLPQRDIYNFLLSKNNEFSSVNDFDEIQYRYINKMKNTSSKKILKNTSFDEGRINENMYIETKRIAKSNAVYEKINQNEVFFLRYKKNLKYFSGMTPLQITRIRYFRKLLSEVKDLNAEGIKEIIFSVPKKYPINELDLKESQLDFFITIYELLFSKKFGPRINKFINSKNIEQIQYLLEI